MEKVCIFTLFKREKNWIQRKNCKIELARTTTKEHLKIKLSKMEQPKKIAMVEVDKKRAFHRKDNDVLDSSFSSSFSSSATSIESPLELNSFEEVTSNSSCSSPPPFVDNLAIEPLNDMSSLSQQLPIKRGLSKYYEGKSQSFISLANVKSLKDLVKPENPQSKKLKYCKSYKDRLLKAKTQNLRCGLNALSRPFLKKGTSKLSNSKKSFSSLNVKRISAKGIKLPIPPQRSTDSITNIPKQSALFV